MTNYLRDLIRIVLLSSDALQTDVQRIQLLQKVELRKGKFSVSLYLNSMNF